jgi:hypothetical protein
MSSFSIKGFFDSHIHPGPDIVPRCGGDVEIARGARAAGLAGIVIKNHIFPTGARALTAGRTVSGIRVVGGIVLNMILGFTNRKAVEYAFSMGARILWCPTKDARRFEDAWINGYIDREALIGCFQTVFEYDGTLSTGHLRGTVLREVVELALESGVTRVVLNHPDSASVALSSDEQEAYGALPGVWLERCYLHTLKLVKEPVLVATIVERIRRTGVDKNLISTDLGRAGAPFPWDGLWDWCLSLMENGLSQNEIEILGRHNPEALFFR